MTPEEYSELESKIKDIIYSYEGRVNSLTTREELYERLFHTLQQYGLEQQLKFFVSSTSPQTVEIYGGNNFSEYFLWKIMGDKKEGER